MSWNLQARMTLLHSAEDLSRQTEELRNELEDYNMARMNSFCKQIPSRFLIGDAEDLKKEMDDLHAHNQQVESIVEELQLEKRR